jgi:riboflavin synthase
MQVHEKSFTIYLIPETLRATVFGIKSPGDTVNLEMESTTLVGVET